MSTVSRVHCWSGRIAFLFTVPVVFHCVFILGFQTYDTRVAIHSIVGSIFYGAFAAKVLFVRDHSYPGWVLPVAGGDAVRPAGHALGDLEPLVLHQHPGRLLGV